MLWLRTVSLSLLTCWAAGAVASGAEDPAVSNLIVEGDALDKKHDTKAAIAALTEAEKRAPNDVGIQLRLSKEYSDLVDPSAADTASAEKAAWTALHYAQRSAQLDPQNAKARLSLAICYGKLTDFVAARTKVEYSKLIRDETLASIRLDPTDDFAWHVLGRWNYGIANLNPALRVLCKFVYGGLPEASLDDAIRNLNKAVEIAPQRIIHHSELGKVYMAAGRTKDARKEWKAVVDLPAVDKEDERAKEAARAALKSGS